MARTFSLEASRGSSAAGFGEHEHMIQSHAIHAVAGNQSAGTLRKEGSRFVVETSLVRRVQGWKIVSPQDLEIGKNSFTPGKPRTPPVISGEKIERSSGRSSVLYIVDCFGQ